MYNPSTRMLGLEEITQSFAWSKAIYPSPSLLKEGGVALGKSTSGHQITSQKSQPANNSSNAKPLATDFFLLVLLAGAVGIMVQVIKWQEKKEEERAKKKAL